MTAMTTHPILKASGVVRTSAAYRLLTVQISYPLHLGVSEAGTFLVECGDGD
jgi:4-hydroxy-3-methylbut-2-en-1-yl diphosphate synthase IspG/GcpE